MIQTSQSISHQLISNAGITEGMRVLDFGCGTGELSRLLLEAVGNNGEVIGIDLNERPLTVARNRYESANCSFYNIDILTSHIPLGEFDAVIGRRVLKYLPDPVQVLKKLNTLLKAHGLIAFQEIDSAIPNNNPNLALHNTVRNWIWDTITAEGASVHIGSVLPQLFTDSGFEVEDLFVQGNIQGMNGYFMENVVKAILPRIVHHRIATEEEIEITTLAQRLTDERSQNRLFFCDSTFAIWGRKTV